MACNDWAAFQAFWILWKAAEICFLLLKESWRFAPFVVFLDSNSTVTALYLHPSVNSRQETWMSREDLHYDLREKLGENFHATSHKLLSLGNSFQSNRKIDSDVLRCIENPQAAGQIGLLYQWINRQRFSRSQKRHKPELSNMRQKTFRELAKIQCIHPDNIITVSVWKISRNVHT